MFPLIARLLKGYWGPFRLLESYLVLLSLGAGLCFFLTWWCLPKFWGHLPHDQGKAFVKDSEKSRGKPTGAGLIMVIVFTLTVLLVLPFSWRFAGMTGCLFLCMLTGYFDDRSRKPWGQLRKGLLDLAVALVTSLFLSSCEASRIWLPFVKSAGEGGSFLVPAWLYIPLATAILWVSINAVNCSDGVDGLAGSLAMLTLVILGGFLYGVTGHIVMAKYLILPHYADGAHWAVLIYCACGMLAGYLWHNANPSSVLMGDAGSRFLGLLIGLAGLASGNPLMLLVAAPILLVNGGTGLVKLLILRFLRKLGFDVRQPLSKVPNPINPKNFATDEEAEQQIALVKAFNSIRFPLHDQCRKNWKWSDSQVLVRFMLLQATITPLLILLFIKVR